MQHKYKEEWAKFENYKIEYIVLANKTEEDLYESNYINIWQPQFNKDKKNFGITTFAIPEKEWSLYKDDPKKHTNTKSNLGKTFKSPKQKNEEAILSIFLGKYNETIRCFKQAYKDIKSTVELKFDNASEGLLFVEMLSKYGSLEIKRNNTKTYTNLFGGCEIDVDGSTIIGFNEIISEDSYLLESVLGKIEELGLLYEGLITTC